MKPPLANEIRKPTKTLAGVTPIAVMSKPRKCKHGTCLYCPSLDVPQSYTPKSPPVLRAERLNYDPYEQILSRLKAFELMNHPTEKIELIIMGGTFLDYPIKYQYEFIKRCYDAFNSGKKSKDLAQAKKFNETAKHRCVALCIETRPDTCSDKEIKRILEFGCTRVEIGVQCLDDKIYDFVNRGHTVKEVIDATHRLKEAGFKIGYHMMIGLPQSNPKKDFEMFKELFNNENYKPDQLKIYPCQVIKGSGLSKLYEKGKYKPYDIKVMQDLLVKIMRLIPNYCRVMRVMREIPPDFLIAGTERIDLRKDVEEELRKDVNKNKNKINEIRYREIGLAIRDGIIIDNNLKMKISEYKSSSGKEYFLEFINKDNILFGLLRLRICSSGEAIIREVHVYGQALSIGEKGKDFGQHKGMGKELIKKAEKIVKENGIKELKIISGVGVKEYYKKLGYKIDKNGIYMEKRM